MKYKNTTQDLIPQQSTHWVLANFVPLLYKQHISTKTGFRALCLNLVLVACCMHIQKTTANELEGAWKLDAYQIADENIKVTGLLVLQEKNFGMIYLMESENGKLSARSHTGEYHVKDDQLFFDVHLWVEEVDKVARIIPATKVGPHIELNGEELVLRFDSGSSQTLSKLSPRDSMKDGGDWQLKNINMMNGSDSAKGSLVTAGSHFVLVYIDKEQAGWGYGGLYDHQQRKLVVNWNQDFKNGKGSITRKQEKSVISTEYAEPVLIVRDSDGNKLEFTQ